jgi:Cu/Ag efflux protein CusF
MKKIAVALALFLAAVLITFTTGCSGDQPKGDETNDTVVSTPATSPDTTPAESTPGEVKSYTFHGVVTAIDEANNMITVDHEKIGDYMEAMTMPFKVADPAILKEVKVGDSTHFTLRVAGDQALITKVEKGHEEGESH